MEPLFLRTKLFVPSARPALVQRSRLIERLVPAHGPPLTLVCAPAGAGKTTLLREWIDVFHSPVAWLSLDEGDNDPTRFWTYIIAALQTVWNDFGANSLDSLRSPQTVPIESVLAALINEIAGASDPLVLVLDDYHAVKTPAIHEAMAFLVDHLPPQLRIVISSRVDPLLPLGRMRVRGQLLELREPDLRFTPEEASTFLNQVMGLGLSALDIAALEARTEGWVAG
ncbi:MAG TPA: AAA family ATPase, partial [Aggregatilineales bacterium]|nr:AAA family ATPase [Aggregatilineales bacterium]